MLIGRFDMKPKTVLISFAAAIVLAGCGGGGDSTEPTPMPGGQAPSAYEQATNKARTDFQNNLNALQVAADNWMEDNARKDDIITLASGLQYKINKATPDPDNSAYIDGQSVVVHYKGQLTDGTIFDSTFKRGKPENLLPGDLIEGWQEALKLMSPGDEWTLFIPPTLGYGKRGYGSKIPANAVLIFDVELR